MKYILILAVALALLTFDAFAKKAKASGDFKRASECKAYSEEHGNGNFDYRPDTKICYYYFTSIGKPLGEPLKALPESGKSFAVPDSRKAPANGEGKGKEFDNNPDGSNKILN